MTLSIFPFIHNDSICDLLLNRESAIVSFFIRRRSRHPRSFWIKKNRGPSPHLPAR